MNTRNIGMAYAHVQRKLTEQERTALRESLQAHGLRDEITLDQHGDILDGYNRENLCGELGIERRYRSLEVADPVYWIRHNQTARRNLTEKEMRELIVETKTRNPEASTRTIAEKLGASKSTVARALKDTTAPDGAVNSVKGKDGKVRTYTPKPKVENEKFQAALHVYDRRKLAGEPITQDAIAEEAGVSITPARRAIVRRKAEEALGNQEEIVLSASMQARFDTKVSAIKKQLELEMETRVIAECEKRLRELSLPHYFERLKTVENLLNSPRWAVMSSAHFKTILACLHPDNSASKEKREEAFRLFNNYKLKMIDLGAEKTENDRLERIRKRVEMSPGTSMPRTVEELMARKTMKRRV